MSVAIRDISIEIDDVYLESIYSGVGVSIVHITPEVAALMLQHNRTNRRVNEKHVRNLTDVFEAGDMILNGETIIFDTHGNLLNGQHRLIACTRAGIGFDAMVVRGIDRTAFKTMDSGRKRSSADSLSMTGEMNATRLAAAVQALVAFVDGNGVVAGSTHGARKATSNVAERVLATNPGLRDSVIAMKRSKLYDNQQGYLLHYLFSLVSKRIADDFADCMAHPHSDVGRPFVRLRESLINSRPSGDYRRVNAAKAIKAFNAERSGKRPQRFQYAAGEQFPRVDGLDYVTLKASLE